MQICRKIRLHARKIFRKLLRKILGHAVDEHLPRPIEAIAELDTPLQKPGGRG